MKKSVKSQSNFENDFLRMTGEEYHNNLRCYFKILLHHNIKYMWWWRKRDNKSLKLIRKIQLFRYAKKYGIEIGDAPIGKGVYLGHAYNITVNENAVLGENINLHKGVTIGIENRGKRIGAPTIGNNVYIGVNSTVVGNIMVGDDVLIAPNSYVNFNIPSHSVVIGNPAQIYPKENATEGYVNFIF